MIKVNKEIFEKISKKKLIEKGVSKINIEIMEEILFKKNKIDEFFSSPEKVINLFKKEYVEKGISNEVSSSTIENIIDGAGDIFEFDYADMVENAGKYPFFAGISFLINKINENVDKKLYTKIYFDIEEKYGKISYRLLVPTTLFKEANMGFIKAREVDKWNNKSRIVFHSKRLNKSSYKLEIFSTLIKMLIIGKKETMQYREDALLKEYFKNTILRRQDIIKKINPRLYIEVNDPVKKDERWLINFKVRVADQYSDYVSFCTSFIEGKYATEVVDYNGKINGEYIKSLQEKLFVMIAILEEDNK